MKIAKEDILIRPATNQDSDAGSNLIFDIWINEYHLNVKRDDLPDLKNIEKYYNHSGGLFLVAVYNDQIIGTIACEKLDDISFALKRMFITKEFRGIGIAQLLLDRLLSEISTINKGNAISFYLSTKEDQAIAAKKLYLKNGFKVISSEHLPSNFPFFYEDDLFMHRQITP